MLLQCRNSVLPLQNNAPSRYHFRSRKQPSLDTKPVQALTWTNGLRQLVLNYRTTNILGWFCCVVLRNKPKVLHIPSKYFSTGQYSQPITDTFLILSQGLSMSVYFSAKSWDQSPWVKMEAENRVLTLIGIFYSFALTRLAPLVALEEMLRNAQGATGHNMLLITNLHKRRPWGIGQF